VTLPANVEPAESNPAPDSTLRQLREDLKRLDTILRSGGNVSPEATQILDRLDGHLERIEAPREKKTATADEVTNWDIGFFDPGRDAGGLPSDFCALTKDDQLWPGVAAVSMTIVIVAVLWFALVYGRPDISTDHGYLEIQKSRGPRPLPVNGDFSHGEDLLDEALGHFPGQRPEDVLTRVHNENLANGINVCAFEWSRGDPSLLFGTGNGHVEIGEALNRCAEAVEKAAPPGPLR
jgi:hypothetical protein